MDSSHDREWVRLYESGLSTNAIARKYAVSAATVQRHLRLQIKLRDKWDASIMASTKYPKKPFSGSRLESAYLFGFIEDCHVRKEGRLIEVSTTTTHPSMEMLFRDYFKTMGTFTA